jgi:ethanolamine ammonia-lyase small subunit
MSEAELTRRDLRQTLRQHTAARVLLDRAGDAVSTGEQLAFQLDHALARDAVHSSLDVPALSARLAQRGIDPLIVESAADSRPIYLRRPDLGRTLSPRSRAMLLNAKAPAPELLILVADGLSALAVERHAIPLLAELQSLLDGRTSAEAVYGVATQARVALGDELGTLLGARLVLMLIGERPGLSAPDSLGAYLTWNPQPGRTDAERNCISNIRQGGLGYREAAARIVAYVTEAQRLAYTGVNLKEPQSIALPEATSAQTALSS